MMKKTRGFAVLAACVVAAVSCGDSTATTKTFVNYSGALSGAKEKPTATASTATGTIVLSVNEANHLTYNLGWMGLTGNATGAHIHGPAVEDSTAAVLVDFQALPTGSPPTGAGTSAYSATAASGGASGTVDLKNAINASVSGDSLKKLLNAGLLYVNVHTAANPGGEIRAQLKKQ